MGLSRPPQVPTAGSAQRQGKPAPPSPPPPGGSETRTQGGTGSRDAQTHERPGTHGPQQAAPARAGPASRVTGRPRGPPRIQRPDLSSDKSPEDSVSAITRWPKMPARSERYTSPGDRRSSHRPRRRPREPATRTSVPKIATIAARHGAPRALWSTPGHTPEQRRARDVLPATRATQGPARVSRARLGSVFGRPLVRPGHTRDRRPAKCDPSGRTRAQGALSDSPRGLENKRSRQRDGGRARGPLPGTRGTRQDGPRLPTGTWGKKNSAAASDGQDARGPATGPGRVSPASRPKPGGSPRVAGQASGAELRRAGRPTPAAPHPAQARKRSDNLSPHKPARPSSDSQATRQSSGATGTARLTTAVFPELCLAHSGDGPLPRQLPPQLRKPRERYKSGRQMESDNRRERHQDRSGWQAGPPTAKPKP